MKTMKYLEALFNEGSCDEEIEGRIGAASKVIEAMRSEVLERRELNNCTILEFCTSVNVGGCWWPGSKSQDSRSKAIGWPGVTFTSSRIISGTPYQQHCSDCD